MAIDRKKYLDAEEVGRLRTVTEAACVLDLKAGRRRGVVAWALVDTALSTGLRVSEIAALTVEDLDARRGALQVWRMKRKTHARESLAIPPELVRHLHEFIEWKHLANEPTEPSDAIFRGERGPLSANGLQVLWKACIKRAGLPRELSIHTARHTVAVHLLKKTSNLRMVQRQLGHASPTTTANLYCAVSFEDMQDGMTNLYPS